MTCLLHAVYTQTNQKVFLYQVKNLVYQDAGEQKKRFYSTLFEGKEDLLKAEYRFLRGDKMCGNVIGGNARCLLKLAGTPFWPDFHGKSSFLEALGGGAAQITDYLSHYRQLGVFEQIKGVLLGDFYKRSSPERPPGLRSLFSAFRWKYHSGSQDATNRARCGFVLPPHRLPGFIMCCLWHRP